MIKIFKNSASFRIKWYKEFTDVGYQNTLIEIDNNNLIIIRKNLEPIILDYNQIEEPITSSIEQLREELYCWIDDALKLSIPLLDTHIVFNNDCLNLQNFNGDLYWRGEKLTSNNTIVYPPLPIPDSNWQYYQEYIINPDLINVINPVDTFMTIDTSEDIVLIQPGVGQYVDDYNMTIEFKAGTIPYNSTIIMHSVSLYSDLLKQGDKYYKTNLSTLRNYIYDNTTFIDYNMLYPPVGSPLTFKFKNNNTNKLGNGILKIKVWFNLTEFINI